MKRYFRAPWLSVIGDKQHHQCVERFHLQGIHERFARSKALSLRYPPSGQQHRILCQRPGLHRAPLQLLPSLRNVLTDIPFYKETKEIINP